MPACFMACPKAREERRIDPRRWSTGIEARVSAQDIENARVVALLGPRGEVDAGSRESFEPAPHAHARKEYDRFDERPALLGERLLRIQD